MNGKPTRAHAPRPRAPPRLDKTDESHDRGENGSYIQMVAQPFVALGLRDSI